MFQVPNQYRLRHRKWIGTEDVDGNNGMFVIPSDVRKGSELTIVASDGAGWEHVSVSLKNRTPDWAEMCQIKNLFWGENDVVVQYHPDKEDYVNFHKFCLHLWRPTEEGLPVPASILVGPKG